MLFASNKKAIELIKEKKAEGNVHTTNVMPKDVNKLKVWIFALAGGMIGIDSFYLGKFYKGLYCLLTFIGLYVSTFLKVLAEYLNSADMFYVFDILQSAFTVFGVVSFMMWFVGAINVVTKKYKYPVVLPKETDAQKMYLDELAENKRKAEEREARRDK